MNGDLHLTPVQEEALFRLPIREESAAIEQLISMGIFIRATDGHLELTDCGRAVFLKVVMGREF